MISNISALQPLFNYTYAIPMLGELPLGKIAVAFGVFVVLNIVFWLLQKIILVNLQSLSKKTSTDFDDTLVAAVRGIRAWVYSIVSLYAAVHLFSWPDWTEMIFLGVFLFAVVWQAIEIAVCILNYFTKRYTRRSSRDGKVDANVETMANLINMILRTVLWVLGGLFVMANLGVNVTSLIAGLGIGGIAIAFALQGVLSDLFASFSIYFDRPFRIGDLIVVGTDTGTVEKIGIKSTRLRTLQGEELVISNSELTTARIQNFKKMNERRIVMSIGITYETDQVLVARVPEIVTEAFESFDGGRLDRVFFTAFGDSALLFEIVYFIESPDMKDYLDVQQRFNLQLLQVFTKKGIEFAYPTQTIFSKSG